MTIVNPGSRAKVALAAACAAERWALPLLADLIETNSHADNEPGIAACRHRLVEPLTELGFDVSEPSSSVGQGQAVRRHLWASRPARRDGVARKVVLLLGHLDTVFPLGHPFVALRRDGDRWYGPGASDMKGGVTTALCAIVALRDLGVLDCIDLRLFLSCDEEQGSPTAAPLLRAAAQGADIALCFEAAREGGELVVARKGHGLARAVVHGRTGHAGIAHASAVNSLTALCRLILAAEALEDEEAGLTVSPGGRVVVTPTALGCVPDHAEAELEWRFFDTDAGAAMPSRLVTAAATIERTTGARIELSAAVETPPMPETALTRALFSHFVGAGVALDLEIRGVATAGVGDINLVAAAGVTCLDGVGPEGGGFHSDAEHVVIPTIARRAAMTAVALASWL